MSINRRDFVSSGLTGFAAIWMAGALACREQMDPQAMRHGPPVDTPVPPRELKFLTPDEAKEVEAIAARIIPSDETPGAREAGVVWFIDFALMGFGADAQPLIRDGLKTLARDVARAHPGSERFSGLTDAQQDAFLRGYEQQDIFQFLRFATVAGMFALPKYGGNADYIGWDLIGQGRGYEYTPPFGWYDHPDNQRALLGRVL
jgi:gluconate 2-dehydrogenase gamma chain